MNHSGILVGHSNHRPDAVTLLHDLEGGVDLGQCFAVGDELVHLQFTIKVVLDEAGQLCPALNTTKGTSLPDTSRYKLEGYIEKH